MTDALEDRVQTMMHERGFTRLVALEIVAKAQDQYIKALEVELTLRRLYSGTPNDDAGMPEAAE